VRVRTSVMLCGTRPMLITRMCMTDGCVRTETRESNVTSRAAEPIGEYLNTDFGKEL
jgi:hypothetical protein